MRPYSYEEINAYFQERGYILLSKEYNNGQDILNTLCPVGHLYRVRFSAFKDKKNGKVGSRCSECCTINQKYSQEYIESYLGEYGYHLNEGEIYKGVKYNLNIICPVGHFYATTFESFKRGRRCPNCQEIKNTKYTFHEVKKYVEVFGYSLISTHYPGSHKELHLKCPEGHLYKTTFDAFKNKGNRCRVCFVENRPKKEDHPNWKGGEAQLKQYVRNYLKDWKDESLLYYGGKCVITGETEDLDIHHLYSFELIFREVLEELDFPYFEKIGDYSSEQLKILVDSCKKAHAKYPLGVPLTQKVHLYFHTLYPKETIPEHFYEFALKYYNVDRNSLEFTREHIPKRKRESLTDEEAIEAWKRVNAGDSCRQIAKDYGVSGTTIENLANGKTYKRLNLVSLKLSSTLSEGQILEIRVGLMRGFTGVELAKQYNVSTSVISTIRRGSSGHSNSRFLHLPPLDMGWRKGKLSRDEIFEIRERAKAESPSDIAKDYGISRQLVYDIKTKRRYKDVV